MTLVEPVETKMVRLGDIADLKAGFGFPKIYQGKTAGDYPFAKVGDISRAGRSGTHALHRADHYVDESDLKLMRASTVPAGSVLFAKIGEAIRQEHRVVAECALAIDNNAMAAVPGSLIDSRYLFRFLQTVNLYGMASSTTVPSLRKSQLSQIQVPLPPLPEQRRIAAILDKTDHLRTQRREALARLDALTQSMFISMFAPPGANQILHPIVQISEVLESATYGTSEKASLEGDTPVLRMNNITYSGELDLTNLKYMPAGQPEKHLVRDGDLLFNRTNSKELVGKTCVYRGSEGMAYAGYLVRLRLSDQMTPEYLNTFMNLGQTKQLLRNMCKSIVGMANINAKEVQKIRLPLPPLKLQQTFATRVAAVERLKEQHRAQLAKLDALFASLQHHAFRGEL